MNLSQREAFSVTTGTATAPGASVAVKVLEPDAILLPSQCLIHASPAPAAGVALSMQGVHTALAGSAGGVLSVGVLVNGGTLASGTALTGELCYVDSRP